MGASAGTMYARGGSWGLRFVSVCDLMEQVHACLVPSEREFLLACLDEINRRSDSLVGGSGDVVLTYNVEAEKQAAAFHEQGAVEALLEMLVTFKLDEVLLRQAVKTLIPLCRQDDAILDHFLDLGGRDALDDTLEMHKEDHFIMEDGIKMKGIIHRYAKGVARRDAARVAKACRYCHSCRPLVDCPDLLGPAANYTSVGRSNLKGFGRRGVYLEGKGTELRDSFDEDEVANPVADDRERIERLLDHMEKYPKLLDVVEPCVDALIAVAKSEPFEANAVQFRRTCSQSHATEVTTMSGDAATVPASVGTNAGVTQSVLESKCVWSLVKAIKAFPKSRSLQWKGLLAIIHMAKKDPLCFDLGKAGVVQLLSATWNAWDDDEMRQLVLWAMNEVARLETNQLRMSAEMFGALLREVMEPVPERLATTGSMVSAEQAGHYCIPVKLKRLYKERKLGRPFTRKEEEAAKRDKKPLPGAPPPKPLFGKVGDDWGNGESGLI